MTESANAAPLSARQLGAAPHRLMFFIGASNLLLAMLWWALWLGGAMIRPAALPTLVVPPGWAHAFLMQYQVLPSFIFGFLLTVFPRWLQQPELPLRRYLPVGASLLAGQILMLAGACGFDFGVRAGAWLTAFAWLAVVATLLPLLRRASGPQWHAWSCFAAVLMGLAGLVAWIAFLQGASPWWAFASIKIGSFGLLLPIFVTVLHRTVPFFTANVMAGYTAWRPFGLLGLFWGLDLTHLALELVHGYRWLWPVDLALTLLFALICWRWWPRGAMPPLLRVLHLALLWLPVAFALYALQSLVFFNSGAFTLGRAPAHAIFVGFFASMMIAMVTRVTHGHSGRPLNLPTFALYAFLMIQIVASVRIAAELAPAQPLWQVGAAVGWLLALGPWVVRLQRIYLAPRVDGKPG